MDAMRTTVDGSGRVVVAKVLRDRIGLTASEVSSTTSVADC